MTAPARPAKVAILSRIIRGNPEAVDRVAAAGLEVVCDLAGYDALGADSAAWQEILDRIDGLVVGLQPVTARHLATARSLRYIIKIGTGLDNIDLEAARQHGITVDSLAGLNAPAVAEYAFGLLLAAARRIPEADRSMRSGEWTRFTGRHLGGRTLGLIGYGEIARLMVPKARGFGMDVVVARRSAEPITDEGVRSVSVAELLALSDFVSVHVPLTEQTRGLLGAAELAAMRPGAVLVNTARGAVVDEAALYDALVSGHLAAAGLDVWSSEPPTDRKLLELPTVVASPHNGGYSDLTTRLTALTAVDRLIEGVRREAVGTNQK
ncbi:NAD(P)-dependent oxidoreductase [Amycolatopsis sp. NPDC001319]|uniref:NAD(P)-dependent oxidoreductase n=1 Tax=unclassified Amycolatopsis TaxID=2618356 RepID=UPI003676B864